MSHEARSALIKNIEEIRGSKVLVYVTGDRPPFGANIGDDAVRPIVEHLRQIGSAEKLDVFIYSRGGAIDVPWRLNTAFLGVSPAWNALIPFRANSAATLLSLGANEIVMGKQGELGPIDPIMNMSRTGPAGPTQENISVEDVMAFPKFVSERLNIKDERAQSEMLAKLTDRLDAVSLGGAYRTHSHIRYLAEKMLNSHLEKLDHQKVQEIIETLAERVYAHGHAVALSEAQEIGLPAVAANDELDAAMWSLLEQYEADLKILDPMDPMELAQANPAGMHQEEVTLACVESVDLAHEFKGTAQIQAQRQMPPSLQVNVNLQIQMPPGGGQPSPQMQQVLQQLQPAIVQSAQQAVQSALQAQAPIVGCDLRLVGARWHSVN